MNEHSIDIGMMLRTSSVVSMCWLLLISLPHSYSDDFDYAACKKEPYECGHLKGIFYPFWGYNHRAPECGGGDPFMLTCHDDVYTTIQIGSQNFTVKEIDMKNKSMRLGGLDLASNVCSLHSEDIYVNFTPILYPDLSVYNITIFYNCSSLTYFNSGNNFTCGHNNFSYYFVDDRRESFVGDLSRRCKGRLHLPTDAPLEYYDGGGKDALEKMIGYGFTVNYNVSEDCGRCLGRDAECWMDGIEEHVDSCYYCQDGSHNCSKVAGREDSKLWLSVIGSVVTSVVFLTCIIVIICCCIKSLSLLGKVIVGMTRKNDDIDIEAFLKDHGSLAQKRYKFSEVKKMTNSFKVKLGEGGFGAVYKGDLLNGSPVAVKILNASKGNGKDFINEVDSISRTSHINVVSLLGFCLEGHKKALIYEFMPNGSLDKFIYSKRLETTESLSWVNLLLIAKGIARGLEYLHRGCNTRILHFDIKPHNILLDENFCPKISDFGLSKLCPRNESIISMSDQRGTIGYVAPEVWNRQVGGISYKSDVYSYGMMLLEMVGGRKNINAEASNTSEIYFPDWIYKRLEQGGDLGPDGVIGTEENEIARRMTVVGLWCVQTFPRDRPTMSRVIEMLEGNMNSVEMPPKPVISSPTRSVPDSISTSSLQSA